MRRVFLPTQKMVYALRSVCSCVRGACEKFSFTPNGRVKEQKWSDVFILHNSLRRVCLLSRLILMALFSLPLFLGFFSLNEKSSKQEKEGKSWERRRTDREKMENASIGGASYSGMWAKTKGREWTLHWVKRLRKLHQITDWWRQMTKKIKQAANCVADENVCAGARCTCTGCFCSRCSNGRARSLARDLRQRTRV